MTKEVISVQPDQPVRDIAGLLLDHQVSAVPVVRGDGSPIGMVSEGDLIGRDETDRLARKDWWLALMNGQEKLDDGLQQRLEATAGDVMSAPLVTVTEDTELDRIAQLMTIHHVKRVPVLRDGRLVGIVSRADLLRAVASGLSYAPPPEQEKAGQGGFLGGLFGGYRYHRPAWQVRPPRSASRQPAEPDPGRLAADDFRHLVEDFKTGEAQHHDAARKAAAEQRRARARQLIDVHVFDEGWHDMLHKAREAAQNGQTEYLLLRFPSQLCIDGGRAINVAEPGWPTTLRGEPAELYLRWQRELKPHGFKLSARVLDFPDGKPGDISLFLIWGE